MTTYRPDIDGLRCVAVLLVILFHLDFDFMRGGFIGVDVFFVISGYLITGNILKAGSTFRYGDFLARRVRRLMPAIWTTVGVTMLAAAWIMRPESAQDAGQSALAAVFSVSNVFFWLQSDYWDSEAEFKPFLHTWSLAVEEQFYLLWPLLLLMLRRWFGARRKLLVFVVLALAGTAVSEWAVRQIPSAAFYWMPFRVHEFAFGAVLAVWPAGRRFEGPNPVKEVLVLLGLGLILASGVVQDETTQAPGLWAWPAGLGTLLVLAVRSRWISRALLENPVSVYLGKISYSLYLVHWPIVSLYKYRSLDGLDTTEQGLLGMAMLGAGVVLHHLVEAPFRHYRPARPVLAYAAAAAVAVAVPLAAIGAVSRPGSSADPATERDTPRWAISRDQALAERDAPARACRPDCDDPIPGRFNVLIIGDSHGPDAFNALAEVFPEANLIPAWWPSCAVMRGLEEWYAKYPDYLDEETRRACLELVRKTYEDTARLSAVDLIVFNHLYTGNHPELLDMTLEYLDGVTTAPILVFGNAPAFTQHLPDIVHVDALLPGDTVPERLITAPTWEGDVRIAEVVRRHGDRAAFIPKLDFFCPERRCRAFTEDGSRLISYDGHHLSLAAARALGRAKSETVRAEVARRRARAPED